MKLLGRARGHGAPGVVTVHSMGGLGNQLFIYAAGAAAAQAAGAPLRIDVGQHAARADRPFQLELLGFPAEYVSVTTPAGAVSRERAPDACDYREVDTRFDPAALQQETDRCMYGYFQSWRYVEPVAEEMRGHFTRLRQSRRVQLEVPLRRLTDPTSIVLHVRRGDYLHSGAIDFHGVARNPYYTAATDVLRRMGFTGVVYVASDDPEGAVAELSGALDVRPLSQEPLDALDEMLLMSAAPALVMANSSFSWWAAWTGDQPERPVISPRPWFDAHDVDSRDLLLPHWLTLDRRI